MNTTEGVIHWEFFLNIKTYYFITSKRNCFYDIDSKRYYVREKSKAIFLPDTSKLSEEELFQYRIYWDKEDLINFDELCAIQNFLSTKTITKHIDCCIKNYSDKLSDIIVYTK